MPTIHITLKGVVNCTKRLNPKKAIGLDKMLIIALKETASEKAPILQSLFQQSLDTHKVPNDCKQANIVPIFKTGDRS